MKYICSSLTWDVDYYVDESELDLPESLVVEVHMDDDSTELDLEEALSNAIADATGWCIFQFEYEEVKTENKS